MSFEAQLSGFGYCNDLTGKGWPDYVTLNNGGILSVEYETREYYPVNLNALLELAEEIDDTSCDNHGELSVSLIDIWGWAQAIREALEASDG